MQNILLLVPYAKNYLLLSDRLHSVVKATRYMHARVQIPEKSVPCDCLLPFLALTSITDLTQWLRLQEICTPQVQILDKSSVALCLAFLCMLWVQIPAKSLIANSFLPIFCNMGPLLTNIVLQHFLPPFSLVSLLKESVSNFARWTATIFISSRM